MWSGHDGTMTPFFKLDRDVAPCMDFAVWGPHGNRLLRQQRLSGMAFNSESELVNVELLGPGTIDVWKEAFRSGDRTGILERRVIGPPSAPRAHHGTLLQSLRPASLAPALPGRSQGQG